MKDQGQRLQTLRAKHDGDSLTHDEVSYLWSTIDSMLDKLERLNRRPDIPDCRCKHAWSEHAYKDYRGGCLKCDCEKLCVPVRVGQGYIRTIMMPGTEDK